ncbi:response regulator transcription factor [Flavobacterium davisii]|uniref:Response regulator transcription factor n=1 Tax=Flavobacterium columnare TaxID=996 RepID=A0A8G0KWC4_9FLAO|nr:response regulator transcription factor [Flavobacterium davisii]QYS89682.1 response regulator transcription factor [Flavobacterium davisii]
MKRILLAEDDFDFANVLKQYLELYSFEVTCANDGQAALDLLKNGTFDICILDVMMPKMDGFTLADKIITINPEIPFVFLTARNQNEDKIKGLKLGADDYIVKPFEVEELVLRLTNILKRTSKKETSEVKRDILKIGNYSFLVNRFELKLDNKTQQLTEKEASLLLYLFENRNQLLKREQILNAVWGNDDFFSGRSMDVFISRLRKYFKDDSSIKIESIRNIGLEFKVL